MSKMLTPVVEAFKAEADLSAKQYHFVKLGTADGQIVASAANNNAVGVLLNDPQLNDAAEVAVDGGALVQLGGTVTRGDLLESDAAGKAVLAAGAGNHQVRAIARHSGVANDIIPVKIVYMSHTI